MLHRFYKYTNLRYYLSVNNNTYYYCLRGLLRHLTCHFLINKNNLTTRFPTNSLNNLFIKL